VAARVFDDDGWVTALPPGSLSLVLDFDGTLVDIAPTPDSVVVEPGLTETLSALVEQGHGLVILTGRSARFIVERTGLPIARVVGLHGLEWPGEPPLARRPSVDRAVRAVNDALARAGGAPRGFLIEDKEQAVAFHWRLVADDARASVVDTVARALATVDDPELSVLDGHMMKELRPRAASKGRAIARLAREGVARGDTRPLVFVGDDVTDEEGFAALPSSGVGVRIAPFDVATRASLVVRTPRAVRAGLARLVSGARQNG